MSNPITPYVARLITSQGLQLVKCALADLEGMQLFKSADG